MPKKNVDSKGFDKAISGDKPVLVDFFAAWCGPCQIMHPIVEEIEKEAKDFSVVKVDLDQSPEIAAKNNVMSVPTFIIFKNGKEAERIVGAVPKELLVKKVLATIK